MSTGTDSALYSTLNDRLTKAERRNEQLRRALKEERAQTREIRELLGAESIGEARARLGELVETAEGWDTVLDRLEGYEQQALSPDDKDRRIAELQGEIATGAHRRAFDGVKLAEGATLDDLWTKLEYKAEGDAPTADQVAAMLESAPRYLLAPAEGASSAPSTARASTPPAGATQPASQAPIAPASRGAFGGSRGVRDLSPAAVSYTRDEIRAPGWEQKRPELVAALSAGTARRSD